MGTPPCLKCAQYLQSLRRCPRVKGALFWQKCWQLIDQLLLPLEYGYQQIPEVIVLELAHDVLQRCHIEAHVPIDNLIVQLSGQLCRSRILCVLEYAIEMPDLLIGSALREREGGCCS